MPSLRQLYLLNILLVPLAALLVAQPPLRLLLAAALVTQLVLVPPWDVRLHERTD